MTGIEAGMAMSGNLKNPSRSLPIGNITSLLFAGATYLILAIFLYRNVPTDILASDPFAVIDFARWRSLILLGIWGATLSSALGCLLGAPRMLQSFAEDGIIPEIFSQTFGKHGEPRYSILLTFLLSLILLMSTTIDQIIPILAMICLISYGTLNSVALFAEIINSPSWRPAVRVHLAGFFSRGAALPFCYVHDRFRLGLYGNSSRDCHLSCHFKEAGSGQLSGF